MWCLGGLGVGLGPCPLIGLQAETCLVGTDTAAVLEMGVMWPSAGRGRSGCGGLGIYLGLWQAGRQAEGMHSDWSACRDATPQGEYWSRILVPSSGLHPNST